jgi:hypothetical protein
MKIRRTGEASETPLNKLIAGVQAAINEEWAVIHALLHVETLDDEESADQG